MTISEWISDATLSQVNYTYVANGGKTAAGFTDVYASIRTPIIQKANSLAGSESYTTPYVTGHSLGGALTVLAAPNLVGGQPSIRVACAAEINELQHLARGQR